MGEHKVTFDNGSEYKAIATVCEFCLVETGNEDHKDWCPQVRLVVN